MDQNEDEEVEIKIEPIQNYLKFTNLDAVNQSDYQSAIQMDNDYFNRSQINTEEPLVESTKEPNITSRKVHFSFDKNSLD